MSNPTCGTCRWHDASGDCRRYAPPGTRQVTEIVCESMPVMYRRDVPDWPKTDDIDWCGEHTPKGSI